MSRLTAASIAALTVVLGLVGLTPALAAVDDGGSALLVTAADASDSNVELIVIGADPRTARADVTVADADGDLTVQTTGSSQAVGAPTEIVFVVDTNARASNGAFVEEVKAALTDAVADLSAETAVAVIGAGTSAVLTTDLTTDRAAIAEGIAELQPRSGSSLLNGVDRASALFDADTPRGDQERGRGHDGRGHRLRHLDPPKAQAALVQRGAQLFTVDLEGGEPRLDAVVATTGGASTVATGESFGDAFAATVEGATDRLLITFSGRSELGERANITVTVAGASTTISYPAGAVITSQLQLAPIPEPGETRFAFLRTSLGLYVAVGLAFVGISLGIWAVASIVTGGDSSLDRLLSRYTEESSGEIDDAAMEELIVQSAMLQRAVAFSESFAEKRGFLNRVEDLLERANLPIRAGEAIFILSAMTLLVAGLILVLTRSVIASLFFGLGAAALSVFVVRFLGRRRFKTFEAQLTGHLAAALRHAAGRLLPPAGLRSGLPRDRRPDGQRAPSGDDRGAAGA